MATITKSIGTSSRDYSTITLWEADLDDTGIYTSGDDAVGECYNDATFSESFTLDGGSTLGLSSVLLKPASGEGHDGTADTGVKVESYAYGQAKWYNTTSIPSEIRQIDFKRQHNSEQRMISLANLNSVINRCIVRNVSGSARKSHIGTGFSGGSVYNSILYGYTMIYGIEFQSLYGGYVNIINNTILAATNASACVYGRNRDGTADTSIFKNNLLITQGSAVAYDPATTVPSSFADNKNNMTNYSSFPSTHFDSSSITGVDESIQLVSTVSGSEDLHLASTSDAIGAGADLGSTPDGVQYDIDGQNRDTFVGTTWDIGADQVKTPASIGTSSRDYSTIALWEADLDDTSLYASGDGAVGECYNDSTFTAGASINGGTTVGLSSVTLSVAEGQRHDGTLSAGVFINPTYSIGSGGLVATLRDNATIEWLTCEVNGTSSYAHTAIIRHDIYSSNTLSRNMVLKGENQVYPSQTPIGIRTGGHENIAHNNIIYGIANGSIGAGIQDSYRRCNALSNTIYGCNYGYQATAQGNDARNVKNNLSIGNNSDFYAAGTTGYTSSNNASSDSTATALGGSNHVTGAPASRQFVSTLSGSEDLHLIFKSAAIDAGVDLGAPSGVQYDIDGKDRDTENSIWDIGAHEYGDNVIFGLLRV